MLPITLLSLVGLAAAGPISAFDFTTTAAPTVGVTVEDLNKFRIYAEWSAAAYCNSQSAPGSPIRCGGSCPTLEGDVATIVQPLKGGLTGIAGYVGVDHARQEIVLAVRGSNNILNWLTNIRFGFKSCDLVAGCQAHDGFVDAWNEIYPQAKSAVGSALAANPGYRLIISGHSLGGAVATLGAAYLRRDGFANDVYTYGSPRVGNAAFTNFVTAQAGAEYRVTHGQDPVPRLPPIVFNYRHTSPEFWLANGESTKLNYAPSEILVCEGVANTECNAKGLVKIDIDAHQNYLIPISACELTAKRDDAADVDLEELTARLNEWAKQDQAFVDGQLS
jgi:hypothetical protein